MFYFLLLLCPFVGFLSLFFTNYELLILTMIAVLFYGIYLSLPVWRNFFLLSFYALEDILLFCFHFICFAFILTISYFFLYVCFFQPHVLILRFSWALISMLIFYLFFSIITFVKTKAFGLVFDKRDFFFNLLSRYLFFLFLSSINYFIYMFLPNKYFILFIFLQLFFISNILNFFSNIWKPAINKSSFFNLTFRFFNIAPLLIICEAFVPGSVQMLASALSLCIPSFFGLGLLANNLEAPVSAKPTNILAIRTFKAGTVLEQAGLRPTRAVQTVPRRPRTLTELVVHAFPRRPINTRAVPPRTWTELWAQTTRPRHTNTRALSTTSCALRDTKVWEPLSSTEVIPVSTIAEASLDGNQSLFNSLMLKYNLPALLGMGATWTKSQDFVHIAHVMQDNLSNDSFVINQVNNVVPSENLLVAPVLDVAFLNKLHLLMKTHNIVLAKPAGDLWMYYTGGEANLTRLSPQQSAVLDYVYIKAKHLFVPTNQFNLKELFRHNLGDLYVFDADSRTMRNVIECKSVRNPMSLDKRLDNAAENYEGLDLQVLDVQNKRMHSKSAVGGDYISVKVGPFDDVAISKKIKTNNQLLLEHDHSKDLLLIKSLPEFRLSNNFNKYKLEE